MRIYQISHTDMDGIGCCFPLFHLYKEGKIDYSYTNISYDGILQELFNFTPTDMNIISDLNFKGEEIDKLSEIVLSNPDKKFLYLDHHEYLQEDMDKLQELSKQNNFTLNIDTTICAAKITYNTFGSMFLNDNIQKTIDIIDAYDTWKLDSTLFKQGFMLDKVFWKILSISSIHEFMFRISQNDWKIPEDFIKLEETILKEKERDYEELKRLNLIYQTPNVFMFPTVKWISDSRFDFPGSKVYIGFSPTGNKVSVRVMEDYPEVKELLERHFKPKDYIMSMGGHNFAFGLTYSDPDKKQESIEEMIEILEKHFLEK